MLRADVGLPKTADEEYSWNILEGEEDLETIPENQNSGLVNMFNTAKQAERISVAEEVRHGKQGPKQYTRA